MDDGKFSVAIPEPGWLDTFLSLLFPLMCVHCGQPGAWLCPACAASLRPVGALSCRRCGRPSLYAVESCRECRGRFMHFAGARAGFHFEGPARSIVHGLKYGGQRRLAGLMAAISADFKHLTAAGKEVTLTYVPMHRSKLLMRGYNQAECYARALSRRHHLPVRGLLTKVHPTPPQNQLGLDQRGKNVAGSFALAKGARVSGQQVVLIDDVYTTGSTADACARVLRLELGVVVNVWTFARTVRRETD
ncbi:MAG: ComF family protein [Actinobacteria bacterium]|nr:ComF family protein [Actinomycetota bacterium]